MVNMRTDTFFEIRATRQQTRAGNLIIRYRKKQIDVSLWCVCYVIDNEFRHNIAKVVYGSTRLSPHSYFDNVMTKFMINHKTDA